MVQNVASVLSELEPEDFHLLSGVEQGMRFSEYVNRDKLTDFSRLSKEDVDYRLDRCEDRELVERKTMQYEGFKLTFEGYDALALHTFVERDTLGGFGSPLGVGKESDVYEVQSYKPLALKYHREGYTNFREVMKEREYTADQGFVHADISEYNVFVTTQGVVVFDWPQAVPTDHENSDELLARDVDNIVSYFQRKYPARVDEVDTDGLAEALATDCFDGLSDHAA